MKTKLRSYQSECEEAIFNDIARGARKLACVLPTGSGKTTIFGSAIKRYLDSPDNAGKRVVVISHLGLLTSQTAERFEKEWGVKSGILQAQTFPDRSDRCIITTMQSFRDEDKRLRMSRNLSFWSTDDGGDIGLIIIDECHYSGCKSYEEIIKAHPEAVVVGFTATPFRENKLMTNIFDKVSFTISMQELIDQGYLVPPKLNLVPFDTTDQADMFAKMITIYREKHNGKKAVIYLKTIEEAKLCRNIFVDSGISCRAVTSELTGEPRDQLLSEFRKGEGPDVLTTVDVLTAGFDSPNLCALFIPYRVGSVTTYLQRVGRGLRPYPNKYHCDVYAGATSPGVEDGFWEKMTKKMLIGGRPSQDYDTLMDILEFADISKEKYEWTKSVVDMANDVKKKGMSNLFNLIVTQKFPEELLNAFVQSPPFAGNKAGSRVQPSDKQLYYLRTNNLPCEGLTKNEASAIITGHKKANGWKPEPWQVVPAGNHKGKMFTEVPQQYWNYLRMKFPSSEAYQAYMAFKQRIGRSA